MQHATCLINPTGHTENILLFLGCSSHSMQRAAHTAAHTRQQPLQPRLRLRGLSTSLAHARELSYKVVALKEQLHAQQECLAGG